MATQIKDDLLTVLTERWRQSSEKLEQAAAEIPTEKFDWRPVDAVRSAAEVIRHAAYWNRHLAAVLRGEKADDSGNELPAADYPTKEHALAALKESSAQVSAALNIARHRLPPETLGSVAAFSEHNAEHYGQLAVYCRLLEIVPPASRA